MGHQELIESLKKEAENKIRSIRNETDAEIEKVWTEASGRIRKLREEYAVKQASSIRERTEHVTSLNERNMRNIHLSAIKTLSDRLFLLASSLLNTLRDEKYSSVFAELVKELPPCQWKEVRVNPEDTGIVSEYFPDSTITDDTMITGGFIVMSKWDKICITNTFEKRLERAWEDMLPSIISDVYQEATKHEHPVYPGR
jgi:vacuolar-type H+-ATPase subunit E/Vma4